MTPAATALTVTIAIVAIGSAVGFLAGSRQRMDLEQWTVGSRGGPVLCVLAYLSLAYAASFFILPQLWEVGRKHRMQTQPDFFNTRYHDRYLAGFVCVVGILAFMPYLQLQLDGVGIIVSTAS